MKFKTFLKAALFSFFSKVKNCFKEFLAKNINLFFFQKPQAKKLV